MSDPAARPSHREVGKKANKQNRRIKRMFPRFPRGNVSDAAPPLRNGRMPFRDVGNGMLACGSIADGNLMLITYAQHAAMVSESEKFGPIDCFGNPIEVANG